MINSTKMKKIAKADVCVWGVEEIDGSQYMLVCDGYRVYKDNIYAFDPKVKAALFERFGVVPEKGETLIIQGNNEITKRDKTISGMLPKKEVYEPTYFTNILYRMEIARDIMHEAYVYKTTKGLLFINRDYLDVLKDLDKAEVSTSNGEVIGMNRFTFSGFDTEYYVLPLSGAKEREKELLSMLQDEYEKMRGE